MHPPKEQDDINGAEGGAQYVGRHTQLREHPLFQTRGRRWHSLVGLRTGISVSRWPWRSSCPWVVPIFPAAVLTTPAVRKCMVPTLWSIHWTDKGTVAGKARGGFTRVMSKRGKTQEVQQYSPTSIEFRTRLHVARLGINTGCFRIKKARDGQYKSEDSGLLQRWVEGPSM